MRFEVLSEPFKKTIFVSVDNSLEFGVWLIYRRLSYLADGKWHGPEFDVSIRANFLNADDVAKLAKVLSLALRVKAVFDPASYDKFVEIEDGDGLRYDFGQE